MCRKHSGVPHSVKGDRVSFIFLFGLHNWFGEAPIETTENKTYYNGVLIGMESLLKTLGYSPVYQDHATVTIIKAGK